MFPLLPLWGLRSILQKKEVEQLQSTQKLRLKYTQISNGLIRTGDIVADLFQSKVLTVKEKDDIQHLLSTPVRANEQLLNTLMIKDDQAYDCFLKALGNTDQTHIAEVLHCEDKYLDIRHCLMIQENYNELVDNLDVDCGHLLDRLHEDGALKRREMESISAKPTKHEKSETLLALVSKFSPANFQKFLQGLEKSSQEHVVSIMMVPGTNLSGSNLSGMNCPYSLSIASVGSESGLGLPVSIDAKTESEVSTSIADKSNLHFKESGLEVGSQKNRELQGDSSHDLHHKQQKKTRHCVKRMEKSSLIVKRKSTMTVGSKFANLPDELQTDLSLKVATLHQKTVLTSETNVELCFSKLLTDFIQQKREVNRKQNEVEDMRDILKRVNESAQNSTHQFEDKFKTEIQILNEELLLHRTNNRLLNDSLKTTEIVLGNEKQKSRELERQLIQSQNESDNPLKQIDERRKELDERRKELDREIQVLNEELLLHRTNNSHLNETLKKTVIELDNEKQKSEGLETQLDQFQNELKTTVIELDNETQKNRELETQLDQFQNELKTTVIGLDNETQKNRGLETQVDQFQNELKTTVLKLDNEKEKNRGFETQLIQSQNESDNLLKQRDELRKELDERRKELDREIQVLNEELALHRTNNRQLDETLKTTVIELDNEKKKSRGLETQLDQFQNELKTTVIELDNEKQKSRGLDTQLKENQYDSENHLKEIDELRKELDETLSLNDESKKKFEGLLKEKDEMVSELKQKLEQEMKVWADQKEQLMNRIQELQKEHSDEMASGLRQQEEQRMILAEEKEQLMNQIQELQQEYSECRETLLNLEEELVLAGTEKDRLNEQIQEYRRFAGELPYKSDPVLIGTIRTKAAEEGNKSIRGLAILDKELFVVSEDSSEIEVYDSLKFSFSRRWNSTALSDPQDIGSCNINKCLYISNYKYQSSDILRVGPNGKLILVWSTGGDYGSLSVTDESNVILAPLYGKKLYEYSPDGLLIRQISPHWPVRHCLKLANGGFVVCGTFSEMLCIVNAYGKPEKSFDGELGFSGGILNAPVNPVYLSVDGNGFVLVADVDNSRVLLFDSDLKFMREILSKDGEHGIQYPRRILLDESSGRLFVADHKDNNERISIFSL